MATRISIGRTVTVHRHAQAYPELGGYDDSPVTAIVTYVHNPVMVSVVAFNHMGQQLGMTHLRFVQSGQDLPAEGAYCTWPAPAPQEDEAQSDDAKASEPAPTG